MSGLRRVTSLHPGYDCVRAPCGKNNCGTSPGANHGIHCDEWVYAIGDAETALALTAFSGMYPTTVPPEKVADIHRRRLLRGEKMAQGTGMELHTTFPCDRDTVRRGTPAAPSCEFLNGRACYREVGSILVAGEFFGLYGVDRYEQLDAFWVALEGAWRRWSERVRENRADTHWTQCLHCKGDGTVPR